MDRKRRVALSMGKGRRRFDRLDEGTMKIAIAAVCFENGNISFNIAQMKKWMETAKKDGADLVCFGEAFLQGMESLGWNYDADINVAVSVDSAVFDEMKEASRKIGIDVMFGYYEREDGKIYSSYALLGGGEVLYNARRLTRGWMGYDRGDARYSASDAVDLFTYRGLKCAVAIGSDLWERTEDFVLAEDLLFWPIYITYTPSEWKKEGEQYEYALKAAEAAENVLLINSFADTGDSYGGCSWFDCGEIRESLDMGKEGILFVEV